MKDRMSLGTWLKLAFCPWMRHSEVTASIPVRIKFLERDRDEDRRAQLSLLSLVTSEDVPHDLDPTSNARIPADGLGDFLSQSVRLSIEGLWLDLSHCEHGQLARKRMFEGSYCFVSFDLGSTILISRAQIISSGAQGQVLVHFLGLPSHALGMLETFLKHLESQPKVAPNASEDRTSAALAKSA
jgi:hypothetical protein